ncbi:hypothetical protein PDE_04586 [Penicillium oxalicum 114-2]|uniref:Xylanolytic transcriptional activator regulatory domain-containing protein n=1 Tax=Penicillium oxalicum (strain 114-2 / CGMCC 5302) TaxID=933388 RepID=S7ZLR7_PENO1|nr:hypothetical protein PDE_04586 [Penicillium oxalicum 114-2]
MTASSSPGPCSEEDGSDRQYESRAVKRRRLVGSPTDSPRPSPREIGVMREPTKTGSASFLGSSSGIHFIRHVYDIFSRRSKDAQQIRQRENSSVPGEDDQLKRQGIGSTGSDGFWSPNEVTVDLDVRFSFKDMVAWTRYYFENWHPCFPSVHAPSVLESMAELATHGPSSVDRLDMVIIRSILSISLADERQSRIHSPCRGSIPRTLVFEDVQHVTHEVHILLAENTTLRTLQAVFTAQLLLVSLLRLNAASRLGGIIIRTAFHLGLHRCPGRFSCFSARETEIRRRLFWSIYSLDRYLSQALGIPLGIRDDDIDVCFPNAETHNSSSKEIAHDPRLDLLSHLARFAQVRGLILELRNKSISHSNASTAEASRVNGEIAQWWNRVYDAVYLTDDIAEFQTWTSAKFSPCHRLLLEILRHEAIISMNRPLLAAKKPNPEYKHALQTCISSSRSLLLALKNHLSSAFDAPLTWPSYTWITWIASLILMYASWEGEIPVTTALKHARIAIQILEHLSLRRSIWPETCIGAIKSMQSSLSARSHLQSRHRDLGQPIGTTYRSDTHSISSPSNSPNRTRSSNTMSPTYQVTSQSESHDPCEDHAENMSFSVENARRSDPLSFPTPSAPENVHDGNDSSAHENDAHGGIDSANQSQTMSSRDTAGGVFDDSVNNDAFLSSTIFDQNSFAFSDPFSIMMTDAWSVADRPWMIHGDPW